MPRRVLVKMGLEGEDYVEITEGLEEGQPVLVRSKTLNGDGSEEGS